MNNKFSKIIIFSFIFLYLIVSIISTIHAIRFFSITNPNNAMAIFIAIAFELGAAASLSAIVIRKYIDIRIVWSVFILLTIIQISANTFFAYSSIDINSQLFKQWFEFVNLFIDLNINESKLTASILESSLLPVIALSFVKSTTDYLRSFDETETINESIIENEEPIKKKRGRPKGSKKESKIIEPEIIVEEPKKKSKIEKMVDSVISPETIEKAKKQYETWYGKS